MANQRQKDKKMLGAWLDPDERQRLDLLVKLTGFKNRAACLHSLTIPPPVITPLPYIEIPKVRARRVASPREIRALAITHARSRGILPRENTCAMCANLASGKDLHYHHDSESAFRVTPLCFKCHRIRHDQLRRVMDCPSLVLGSRNRMKVVIPEHLKQEVAEIAKRNGMTPRRLVRNMLGNYFAARMAIAELQSAA
jgi:hypothetical protein